MPFPVLPGMGRTMNYRVRKKKSTPGGQRGHGISLGLLNNGMGSNIVYFWSQDPSPDTPTPRWQSVRHKQEWVAGAVGNLLVLGVPPL